MATKKHKKTKISSNELTKRQKTISMPVINPHAAGIDIGSRSHFVCVAQDNVNEFGVFTSDLHDIAHHLQFHKIKSVALESTGPYWKQLFVILQDYGFEVILVNARHLKNVKGHKTDVVDSKWIQLLHSMGILSNSFQPDNFTGELRTYTRQRQYLIRNAARYTSKMTKNLVLMNIRLDNVLRDVTGKSGTAVVKAIISGERDSKNLANLFDYRVKADKEDIEKALNGYWRNEYIFELRQSLDLYEFCWEKIRECDEQINVLLESYMVRKEKETGEKRLEYIPKKLQQKQKNNLCFDIYPYAYQMSDGIDISEIDGVKVSTILNVMSETGFDLKQFPTSKHYISWLGFAPNNKISGGKILSSHIPKMKNASAKAYKDAANTLARSNCSLGDYFRRIAYKKGREIAIIATARKIATIVYIMLTKKISYCYEYSKKITEKIRKNRIKNIKKTIKELVISKEELFALQTATV